MSNLFRRTANGDLYATYLGAILHEGLRVWDPSYALSRDPEIWEKIQQDAVVSGAVERGLLSTAGHSWGLEPFSEDPADEALAEILEDLIRRIPRFYESRKNLAEARFLGSAFAKVTGDFKTIRVKDDSARRRWWVPGRLVDIDRRRFRAIAERTRKNDQSAPYKFRWELHSPARKVWEPCDDRTFPLVKHVYADNESRLGYGRGIMDSIYFAYYTRTQVLKQGLQGLARWAQGLLVATVGTEAMGDTDQTNEDIRDDLKSTLLEMLGDNVLVVGEGDAIAVHQGGGEGHQIVDKMLDRVERELNTRIEGTPLSGMDGDGGGAFALGKEHGDREHFQRRFDRESLSESLTHGLVQRVFDMNKATLAEVDGRLLEANLPTYDIREGKSEDPEMNATVAKTMTEAGAPPTKREFYERTGWKAPEDGEDVLEIAQPAGGSPFGDIGSMMNAAAEKGARAAIKALRR